MFTVQEQCCGVMQWEVFFFISSAVQMHVSRNSIFFAHTLKFQNDTVKKPSLMNNEVTLE